MQRLRQDGRIAKRVLTPGDPDGPCPCEGDSATILYQVKRSDQSTIEDHMKTPFTFTVGNFPVVKGMDRAVRSMAKNEKSLFSFHPEFAYKSEPIPGLGQNEICYIEVTLIDFKKAPPSSKFDFRPEDQFSLNQAKACKEWGNSFLANGEFEKAREQYKKGMELLQDNETSAGYLLRKQIQNNNVLILLKEEKYEDCTKECNALIDEDETNEKAYLRAGKSQFKLKNFENALEYFKKALTLLPGDEEITKEVQSAQSELQNQQKREKEMIQKAFAKNKGLYEDALPPKLGDPSDPIVFIVIRVAGGRSQRIHIQLFSKIVPITANNFLQIIVGGKMMPNKKPLTYQNTIFHRLIKGFMIQGGDVENKNGEGGYSSFPDGKEFEDENFKLKHDRRGLLSMANSGPNTNSSQFFITFGAFPHLNGKNVVFGRVLDNFETLDMLENLEVEENTHRPFKEVKIIHCGIPLDKPKFDL